MHGLLRTAMMAYFAIAIHDHAADCGDAPWSRTNLEIAWAGAEATVSTGIFDERLNICCVTEDDPNVQAAWEIYQSIAWEDMR